MLPKFVASKVLAILLLVGSLSPAIGQNYRHPLGVYAHVDLVDAIHLYKTSGSTEGVHRYLRGLYAGMFQNNPGVSGITFGIHWDYIQLNDPDCAFTHSCAPGTDANGNDWSYLEDVFGVATEAGRNIQLIVTPGVDSPPWLFARLSSCDTLFESATLPPGRDCGSVTFSKFPEDKHADNHNHVFPLYWNKDYRSFWETFLTELNAKYGSNDTLVSIAIAGPVGASDEMILPTTLNHSFQQPHLRADDAWALLISNAFPHASDSFKSSDQAFIDDWKKAIEAYVRTFKSITLFLGPDSGDDFPEFNKDPPSKPGWLFPLDCAKAADYPMSCDAKTKIIQYFLEKDANDLKATQLGGMTAGSPLTPGRDGIGIGGVKVLTAGTPKSAPILGGAEFDHSVSVPQSTQSEGCPHAAMPCTVVEAANNVLKVFFDQTEFGKDYGGHGGTVPIQWVDIEFIDILYAQNPQNQTPQGTGSCPETLLDVINAASYDLYTINNQSPPVPAPACQ